MDTQITYSQEVRKMIEKIPAIVVGLGVTVIIVITILILTLSFIIKTPTIISLPITISESITKNNYNSTLVLHIDTTTKLLKEVKTGQKINLQLNDYPYIEYGVIQGQILDVNQNNHIISVKLNKGWESCNSKGMVPYTNYHGTVDIIIKNEPIFYRLFPAFTDK